MGMIKRMRSKLADRTDDLLWTVWVVLTAGVIEYIIAERESRDDD
jgi:hypothetical protein